VKGKLANGVGSSPYIPKFHWMQVTQHSQIHKTFNIQHEDIYMETNTTQYIHVA